MTMVSRRVNRRKKTEVRIRCHQYQMANADEAAVRARWEILRKVSSRPRNGQGLRLKSRRTSE